MAKYKVESVVIQEAVEEIREITRVLSLSEDEVNTLKKLIGGTSHNKGVRQFGMTPAEAETLPPIYTALINPS
jgi:hypothetical protein